MTRKIRRQAPGKFDEKKVKLPGEGTATLQRKGGRLEALGLDLKSILVIALIVVGLVAMLLGTIRAGSRRQEARERQARWEKECTADCTDGTSLEVEIRRCAERCVAEKEAEDGTGD